MCGICGVFNHRGGEAVEAGRIALMDATMRHRGPDDEGLLTDGAFGMGMRRLSIIDLGGGHQPIHNEDSSIAVVFNGEIYNFAALRAELERRGHVFRTRTDTEVIVHGYEEWGTDVFPRLNGMFGAAVWDARERLLTVARDPVGIKPVYYWDDGRSLVFASELRTLLRDPRVPREVDTEALDWLVALRYVPAPRTALKGVRKLQPGHFLRCSTAAGLSIERFAPLPADQRRRVSLEQAKAELAEVLAGAVSRQMVADVPVGLLLSGGVDSGMLGAMMAAAGGRDVDTFTVGFAGDDRNEFDAARAAARRMGARHHELTLTQQEYEEYLPSSVWSLEEPIATPSTLAFVQLCGLASEHVKVALSGQGADEPFGGYPRYLGAHYGALYRAIPGPIRHGLVVPAVRRLLSSDELRRAAVALDVPDKLERVVAVNSVASPDVRAALLKTHGADRIEDAFGVWFADVVGRDDQSALQYVDARTMLADNLLVYADKMSMSTSLEVRVPFLDLEVLRYVESLPAQLKVRLGRRKVLLKAVARDWLPEDAVTRRKVNFAVPISSWLRGDYARRALELMTDRDAATREYFDVAAVRRLLDEHVRGSVDHGKLLFTLITFELWHEQFVRPSDAAFAASLDRLADGPDVEVAGAGA